VCIVGRRVMPGVRCSPLPCNWNYNVAMKIKVIVHQAEEGGYWAEVPAIPGCATQGETFEELLQNLYEAVEGCLAVDITPAQIAEDDRVLEIAV
jgi:predicted RNase H-like HicB family nuclease